MKNIDLLKELRGLTAPQISAKITEYRKRLIVLEQEKVLGQLKKTDELRTARKTVARAKTVMDEKVRQEIAK